MTHDDSRYRLIEDSEAAISRVRAAIRAGTSSSEAVGDDLEMVRRVAQTSFLRYARSVQSLGGVARDEAFDAMNDRLLDDIWSLTFVSLETGFGSYLKHMPIRIIQRIQRKYRPGDASSIIEHLDELVGEGGVQRHELISDERAEVPFNALGEDEAFRAALQQLPTLERQVIGWRLDEVDNGEIARRLGVSAATASRLYNRAVEKLRLWLNPSEE